MPARVLLTVEETAERLHIGKTKTYALVKSGELESILIGRLRRIHIDAVNAYAARLTADQANSLRSAA
jgi:excisionase family DNA binding protein